MQAYEVKFTPAQRPSLQIADGIRAVSGPLPYVAVGDAAAAGQGIQIPLTARLTASCTPDTPLIGRANAYRDPKSGRIVLGVESAENGDDDRALVLLAAASAFPDGVAVAPEKNVTVLAAGEVRNGRQMLLIWPEGGRVLISDPGRDERYALCRTGDQFAPVLLSDGS